MIRVLIVDDSNVQQELLKYVLNSDPEIYVVDAASNGEEAIAKIKKFKPDVVTMDIHMPIMNGIAATEKIMASHPVPIVIISGSFSEFEVSEAFKAIDAGALAVVEKINFAVDDPTELIDTVKLSAGVKVVRRTQNIRKSLNQSNEPITKVRHKAPTECKVIAIGVSTGGPLILKEIFERLNDEFPPILVVQHISAGFLKGLAEWLQNITKKTINIATDGEKLSNSKIYLAPDGCHMGLDKNFRVVLNKSNPEKGHIPAANFLFKSMANNVGKDGVGIILTGMGSDGALGLKLMKDMGAFTIAQDQESSVIYGMPGEAIAIGGVSEILSPLQISEFINNLKISNIHENKH